MDKRPRSGNDRGRGFDPFQKDGCMNSAAETGRAQAQPRMPAR